MCHHIESLDRNELTTLGDRHMYMLWLWHQHEEYAMVVMSYVVIDESMMMSQWPSQLGVAPSIIMLQCDLNIIVFKQWLGTD